MQVRLVSTQQGRDYSDHQLAQGAYDNGVAEVVWFLDGYYVIAHVNPIAESGWKLYVHFYYTFLKETGEDPIRFEDFVSALESGFITSEPLDPLRN